MFKYKNAKRLLWQPFVTGGRFMRYIKRILAASLACLMLAGCADSDTSGSSQAESNSTQSQSGGSKSDESNAGGGNSGGNSSSSVSVGQIPLLEIETVSKDKNVMDFVTKPTAAHVSRSIASWKKGYKIPPEPYYEACTIKLTDTDGTVSLSDASAQVKVRGNWTTKNDKKPLRIKLDEKQSMLSLNDGAEMKNWVLLAEYKDISMLRNKTAFQIAEELFADDGLYTADSKFVEVAINGEYWGMYLLTEQQQVNKNRINITEPEENYTGTDIGYFLEFDGYYDLEDKMTQFLVNYHNNDPLTPYDGEGGGGRSIGGLKGMNRSNNDLTGFTIKSDIYSQEQHDFIASYMNNVYDIMYEAAYNNKAFVFNDSYTDISETSSISTEEAVRNVVDVDSLADAYILAELACDADLYWSSFFMDVDFGEGGSKKLVFEAPWDFDSAFGLKNRCVSGEGYYAANLIYDVNDNYLAVNPWLTVLMYQEWFTDIIREKWTAAYDNGVFTRAIDMIENDSTELEETFTRNYDRWDNIRHNDDSGEWNRYVSAYRTEKDAADQLKNWLTKRVEFMNSCWHN